MTKLDKIIVAMMALDDGVPFSVAEKMWKATVQTAEDGIHSGDCTKECHSCMVCFVQRERKAGTEILQYIEEA